MKRNLAVLLSVAAALLFSTVTYADHHAVKVTKSEKLGSFLTDTKGMTLYWFKSDSPGKSACTGGCVEKWPLYYRKEVKPPEEVKAADFSTITREDGKPQTTFRGYPLYYFAGDKAAGDANGQGLKDVWFVIDPAKFPPAAK